MISEDNVGMMCRDCPARGGEHNWVSVLFQLTAVVEGQLSKWASAVRVKAMNGRTRPSGAPTRSGKKMNSVSKSRNQGQEFSLRTPLHS